MTIEFPVTLIILWSSFICVKGWISSWKFEKQIVLIFSTWYSSLKRMLIERCKLYLEWRPFRFDDLRPKQLNLLNTPHKQILNKPLWSRQCHQRQCSWTDQIHEEYHWLDDRHWVWKPSACPCTFLTLEDEFCSS